MGDADSSLTGGNSSTIPRVKRQMVLRWVTALVTLGVATVGMFLVRASLDKVHVTLVFLLIVLGAYLCGKGAD